MTARPTPTRILDPRMQCVRCGTLAEAGQRFCAQCGAEVSGAPPAGGETGGAARPTTSARQTQSLLDPLRRELTGAYEVERELGRGGMAVVFKATEVELGRPVALKVLPPELALNDSIAERFKREARMTASLDHPNIMPVYRVGQAGASSYIAMKFVEGKTLDDIIDSQGALPLPVVIAVLRAATSALAYAHERGIVHRDIKGGNIMVDREGRVLVTDFGIARAVEDAKLTQSGMLVGTPYFMSPEQCSGRPVGPQSDQYSLGVVAFQMLAGSVPFDADSLPSILQHHFFTPVPDLGAVRPGLPRALIDVVERAMAKRPEDRFATTAEMLAAVNAVPQTEAERAEGERLLRQLARGEALPKIRTAAVPAAPTLAGTAPAMTRPTAEAKVAGGGAGGRRWLIGAVAAAVLLVVVIATAIALRGPDRQVRRAVRLYANGRQEEARQAFLRVSRQNPERPTPHLYLGRIARERGEIPLARREIETAIQLDPGNGAAHREMGALELAQGNYAQARDHYIRAVALDPDDRAAQGYLGCTLVRMGRPVDAQRFLARAGRGAWEQCVR